MTDHELIRPLLALSAAGLLDADGERRLREHAAVCDPCRAELEAFAQLAAGLLAMPAPPVPADLLSRTQVLLAAEADRREGARLAAAAAVFACVLLLSLAVALRTLPGDSGAVAWLAWTTIPSLLGGATAIVLASRRRLQRSIL